jgi:hypothetical protein
MLLIPVGVEADHIMLFGDKDHRKLFNFLMETQVVETGMPVDCTFDVVSIHRWDGQSINQSNWCPGRRIVCCKLMPIPNESEMDPTLAGSK